MFGLRFSELLIIALLLVPAVLALGEILRVPASRWEKARESQGVWAVLVVVFPLVGPLIYYLVPRPRLVGNDRGG